MSDRELDLFLAVLRNSRHFVEFGTGGSTYLASIHVERSVVSVDSSREWLDTVRRECATNAIEPRLVHVDIGPIGEWGYPTDPNTKETWPAYHESIWGEGVGRDGDLYMVDGRFRIACFAQAVLHCRRDALICFHDFASREQYHRVHEIARQVASVEDLSVFLPRDGVDDVVREIIEKHRYDPA